MLLGRVGGIKWAVLVCCKGGLDCPGEVGWDEMLGRPLDMEETTFEKSWSACWVVEMGGTVAADVLEELLRRPCLSEPVLCKPEVSVSKPPKSIMSPRSSSILAQEGGIFRKIVQVPRFRSMAGATQDRRGTEILVPPGS